MLRINFEYRFNLLCQSYQLRRTESCCSIFFLVTNTSLKHKQLQRKVVYFHEQCSGSSYFDLLSCTNIKIYDSSRRCSSSRAEIKKKKKRRRCTNCLDESIQFFFVRSSRSFYEQLLHHVIVYFCQLSTFRSIVEDIYTPRRDVRGRRRFQRRLFDGALRECIVPSILRRPNQQ